MEESVHMSQGSRFGIGDLHSKPLVLKESPDSFDGVSAKGQSHRRNVVPIA